MTGAAVTLIGGPADGQRADLQHPADSTVYVPTGERGSWLRYRRASAEATAHFQGVYTRPAPAAPRTTKRGRS